MAAQPAQGKEARLNYLHTMVRISDVDKSLDFYCNKLGLTEIRRVDSEAGRFTLIFLAAFGDEARARAEQAPMLELTHNWDPEVYAGGRNFGHLAFRVADIYSTCTRLQDGGVVIELSALDEGGELSAECVDAEAGGEGGDVFGVAADIAERVSLSKEDHADGAQEELCAVLGPGRARVFARMMELALVLDVRVDQRRDAARAQ